MLLQQAPSSISLYNKYGCLCSSSSSSAYSQRQTQVAATVLRVNGSQGNKGNIIYLGGRGGCCWSSSNINNSNNNSNSWARSGFVMSTAAAAIMFWGVVGTNAIEQSAESTNTTLLNIPQVLSGGAECSSSSSSSSSSAEQQLLEEECKKTSRSRIQRPKSRKAELCTIKCVTTCIRGGDGEGPLNLRRPLVVFKQGFRTRRYCLVECSDICNLIGDGDDGP